jgi:gamma-glutamyltranspeptidase / glutathione hydrolase
VLVLGSTFAVAQGGPSSTPIGEPTAETTSPGENVDALRGDRAGNWPEQSRSEVVARHGIVATSQPLPRRPASRSSATAGRPPPR